MNWTQKWSYGLLLAVYFIILQGLFGVQFIYVSPNGSDTTGDGSDASPFETPERALQAIADTILQSGLPDGGFEVCLRDGEYFIASPLVFDSSVLGQESRPIVFTSEPGETARLTGGVGIDPGQWSPIDPSDRLYNTLPVGSREQVLVADLPSLGITEFGNLAVRGFHDGSTNAMELFVDGNPMQLARWPNPEEDNTPAADPPQVILTGSPAVAGTYNQTATADGKPYYTRDGLVDGLQYHLYRRTWFWNERWYTAWFLTTNESGYPSSTHPFWSHYADELGVLNPASQSGATGMLVLGDPSEDKLRAGLAHTLNGVSDTTFEYRGSRPAAWTGAGAEDIWLHGFWKHSYADFHMPVASIDPEQKTITLEQAPYYGMGDERPFYALNLIHELDQAGEYYLDRTTGKLYLWPSPETRMEDAVVQVSMSDDYLIRVTSTAGHVIFRNLVFECVRQNLMRLEGSSCRVESSIFRNCGKIAIVIRGQDNQVLGSRITNTGSSGIDINAGNRSLLTAGNTLVENCAIDNFGRVSWTYKPGIHMRGVGNRVRHCHLWNAPHTAILYGGNEHRIELNEMHDVCRYSSDAGAIYTGRDWGSRGNVIAHNFIHSISTQIDGYGVHAIYLDDCDSGETITGNVVYRIENRGLFIGGGRDNIITNNLFVDCANGIYADNRGVDWIVDTPGSAWNLLEKLINEGIDRHAEPWVSRYPELDAIPDDYANIFGTHWTWPEGNQMERNAGWGNASWMEESNWGEATDLVFDAFAAIANNDENQTPLFGEEVIADRSTRPASLNTSIAGFVAIPFADIGLSSDSSYANWKAQRLILSDSENDDGDMLPAIGEYYFGLNPEQFDAWFRPQVSGGQLDVIMPTPIADSTVSIVWERSHNLEDWEATVLPVDMSDMMGKGFLRAHFVNSD